MKVEPNPALASRYRKNLSVVQTPKRWDVSNEAGEYLVWPVYGISPGAEIMISHAGPSTHPAPHRSAGQESAAQGRQCSSDAKSIGAQPLHQNLKVSAEEAGVAAFADKVIIRAHPNGLGDFSAWVAFEQMNVFRL